MARLSSRAARWYSPCAVSLLALRRRRPLHAEAPEFRFLASWFEAEARAAFGEVAWAGLDEDALALAAGRPEGDPVLVVEDDLLTTRRSLAAMAAALAAGAEWSAPATAAAALAPLGRADLVHTLRGFERLEAAALERPGALAGVAPRALPASLWRRASLERAATAAGSLAAALERPVASGALAGLAHQFSGYYGHRRDDILPLLPERLSEVLEIGCGDGATGEWLEGRYGCRVTGVELNPKAAALAARRIHRVIAADVESVELDGRFDLVLALELFEHLTRQEEFLARMRVLLAPGGALLLSVPNVGHGAVVEDLIAGRFDYLPVGLLCFTHFRFFTRPALARWFERCGYSRVEIVGQPLAAPAGLAERLEAAGLEVDRESLATGGFFVLARP